MKECWFTLLMSPDVDDDDDGADDGRMMQSLSVHSIRNKSNTVNALIVDDYTSPCEWCNTFFTVTRFYRYRCCHCCCCCFLFFFFLYTWQFIFLLFTFHCPSTLLLTWPRATVRLQINGDIWHRRDTVITNRPFHYLSTEDDTFYLSRETPTVWLHDASHTHSHNMLNYPLA